MRTLMLASAATLALAAVPAKAETVAIVHAHLLTMGKAGAVDGTLVIKDGQIAAVGANVAAPAGARIIDAKGAVVTPGLISTDTAIGAVEVEGVQQTRDEATSAPTLGAAFDVQYSLDADSVLIPIVRATGVTRAVATPVLGGGRGGSDEEGDSRDFTAGAESGGFAGRGLFAGQAAVIHLGQGTDILAKPHAAMVAELGETGAGRVGGGKAAAYQTLKGALDDARHFAKNRAAYDKNAARPYSLSREDLEALIPVVEGKEPLLIGVHRAADIRLVLKLAREAKIKVILDGAEEGWRVAGDIAAAHVPVVLDGEADLPGSFETRGAALENAARLNAAGVSVAIHGPSLFTGGRTPRFAAGRAVAYGLPYEAALASVTINPAQMFGVADKVGSLEVGKDADVVIWSGDPLETTSAPTTVFVKGVEQSLRNRDLELRDRYLKRDEHPGYTR